MRMTTMGQSGLCVSTLCLGTITFGEQNTEADDHHRGDHSGATARKY